MSSGTNSTARGRRGRSRSRSNGAVARGYGRRTACAALRRTDGIGALLVPATNMVAAFGRARQRGLVHKDIKPADRDRAGAARARWRGAADRRCPALRARARRAADPAGAREDGRQSLAACVLPHQTWTRRSQRAAASFGITRGQGTLSSAFRKYAEVQGSVCP